MAVSSAFQAIPHGATVGAALDRFQLIDDFHRTKSSSTHARQGTGRQDRPQRVHRGQAGFSSPVTLETIYVGITLDDQHRRRARRSSNTPVSLRPRSISIRCSAISLSSLSRSPAGAESAGRATWACTGDQAHGDAVVFNTLSPLASLPTRVEVTRVKKLM